MKRLRPVRTHNCSVPQSYPGWRGGFCAGGRASSSLEDPGGLGRAFAAACVRGHLGVVKVLLAAGFLGMHAVCDEMCAVCFPNAVHLVLGSPSAPLLFSCVVESESAPLRVSDLGFIGSVFEWLGMFERFGNAKGACMPARLCVQLAIPVAGRSTSGSINERNGSAAHVCSCAFRPTRLGFSSFLGTGRG